MSRNQPWSESDLEAAKQRMMVRGSVIVRHNAKTVRSADCSNTTPAGVIAGAIPAPSPIFPCRFLLRLQMCSGKNRVMKTKSGHHYPGKRFVAWRAEAMRQLSEQAPINKPTQGMPVTMTIEYWPGDVRTRDVTGMQDALFYLVVHAGIIEDDGLIFDCHFLRKSLDRKCPRVVVTIAEWKGE